MAIDRKYGRVTLETGTIGEDEPVFVFRAQDQLVDDTLQAYWALCLLNGCTQEHLDGIRAAQDQIQQWQIENITKRPGPTGY